MYKALQLWKAIFVCGTTLAVLNPVAAAPADVCKSILAQFKAAAARANREIDSSAANLQQAASQVSDDKRRIALIARSCAVSAEARGVLTSYRIVAVECLDNSQERSSFLNELDREISKIRAMLDRACG